MFLVSKSLANSIVFRKQDVLTVRSYKLNFCDFWSLYLRPPHSRGTPANSTSFIGKIFPSESDFKARNPLDRLQKD